MPNGDTIMKYQLAIFDLDGTLLNTLDDLADAANHVLADAGFPVRTTDEVRRFVGNGYRKLIERAVPAGTGEEKINEGLSAFQSYYVNHCAVRTAPYPGVREMLETLTRNGIKVAIVSNKGDAAVKELNELYFGGLVPFAQGECEGVRRKPAPDTVNRVLEKYATDRKDAVYVGDSDVDVETGKNAGMDCISVLWGFRDEEFLKAHGATIFARDTDELTKLILG